MTTLADLVTGGHLKFSDGYRTKTSELAPEGLRIVRAGDIRGGQVFLDGPDFVAVDYLSAVGEKTLRPGDVVLTTKGTVGRAALVEEVTGCAVYSPQMCFFRFPLGSEIDNRYFYYWLQAPEFSRQVGYLMESSDMAPYVSLRNLASIKITVPNPEFQRRVGEVLGALDAKIATNRRIMTVAIDLCDAEFALMATSAEMTYCYGDIADVSGGGTPSTKDPSYWDGDLRWATPTDITALGAPFLDDTSRRITNAGLANCSSNLYPEGSILMTSRATIGAFALAMAPTATNQGFIVVQALNPEHQLWLFHEMRTRVSDYIAHANGATFLELSRGKFKEFPVAWPLEESAFAAFNARVKPLHDRAYAAMEESRTLATLRNTLLPALMSGRLSVRDAEAAVSEVV